MKGKLQFIWEKERKVQIDDIIYNLRDHIQTKYVKVGNVSFSVDKDDNRYISFIKNDEVIKPIAPEVTKPVEKPKEVFNTANVPISKEDYWRNKELRDVGVQKDIKSQFAIREALKMIEINNALNGDAITPTHKNILENAQIIKQILDDLK